MTDIDAKHARVAYEAKKARDEELEEELKQIKERSKFTKHLKNVWILSRTQKIKEPIKTWFGLRVYCPNACQVLEKTTHHARYSAQLYVKYKYYNCPVCGYEWAEVK